MILLEKLKEQGWYLTEEGLKKLATSNNLQTEDVNKIISLAVNWDLKDIASGALPAKPDNNGSISGRIVLQIQKMRNISAPKSNEESTTAPRFLQLELCDGTNTIAALEFERISSLNLNVPPGTKLFLKADKLQLLHGFLVLKSSDVQVIGGKVEHLVEKWEVARQMLKYARSNRRLSGSGGPPPWIAFGTRLDTHKDALSTDRNFKSLQVAAEKDKNSKENEEFNANRSQAIAEAAKAGQKKVFGGGQQNIVDHNVKKILEKGYSEEDAQHALKTTKNNLERALYNLKRRNNKKDVSLEDAAKSTGFSAGGRIRERGRISSAREETSATKPQTNVSVFDFLSDKLPLNVNNSNTATRETSIEFSKTNFKNTGNDSNRFENNMSSSFAANRAVVAPKPDIKQPLQSVSKYTQEDRKLQSNNKIEKSGEHSNTNKIQSHTQNVVKTPSQSSIQEYNKNSVNNNSSNRRNDRPIKKEKDQTPKQSSSGYQGNKRNNDYKIFDNKLYQPKENSRNSYQSQQKQMHKLNNFEKDLDNLVESTSKINIQNKKDSSYNSPHSRSRNQQNSRSGNQQRTLTSKSQISQQKNSQNSDNNKKQFIDSQIFSSKFEQQNQNSTVYLSQPGNGFAFDPSKIMGFQSKEANEYAMNLLKSQGLTIQHIQQQQTVQAQGQQVTTLPPQQHSSTQILNTQTPPAVAYLTPSSNLFMSASQQTSPQFGMISGSNWPWKIGDLCLAKYWDDGNYYDAKITAVSDKTCVVLFLGYGNHEEILKSDCLPITDAQHIPINAYQSNIAAPPMQQPPLPFQQRPNIHSGGINSVVGGNQRHRGERQMYVPPPKRGNN